MYHLNLLEEQRSSAQRAWRKQINKVTNLIGDSTNIDLLKSERTFLETRMDILYAASNRLCKALADNYEAKKEAVAQLESLEREHSDTLRRLNNKISDLRQDVSERSSWSKHSSRGCRSFKSEKSSIASSLSKRADMAANVARLKTQLEFADAEAWKTTTLECEDELKRFRLSKELAVAKAEMEAVNVADERKIEKDDREEDQFLPQETDRNYVFQNY